MNPILLPIGGTLSGSTCGGAPPVDTLCGSYGPVTYFFVKEPDGITLSFKSTPPVIVFGYQACGDLPEQCWNTSLDPITAPSFTNVRLFGLEVANNSSTCGDFTITVVSQ